MSKNLSDIFPPTEIGGGSGGGIEEAPKTGKMYARKDAAWEEFATGNLDDGNKDGEILTWDTATANWTHDDTLIVKGGNVGIGHPPITSARLIVGGGSNTSGSSVNLDVHHIGSNSGTDFESSIRLGRPETANRRVELKAVAGGGNFTAPTFVARVNEIDALKIDSSGKVGIGTSDNPTFAGLVIDKKGDANSAAKLALRTNVDTYLRFGRYGTGADSTFVIGHNYNRDSGGMAADNPAYPVQNITFQTDGSLRFGTGAAGSTSPTTRMTIDSTGNVGIGMTPLRQASEAKEQLEDWKSAIEERMKAEPKADRSAVTQEITGFDELPTLEQVKERLERAAGDKLQVNGNISASGTVNGGDYISTTGTFRRVGAGAGLSFASGGVIFPYLNGAVRNNEVSLGSSVSGFKDAYFGGTVNAQKFVGDGSGLTNLPSSGTGGGYTAGNGININNTTDQISMSGSYSGTFTATDVVATSDERLKDNITTAPVGLIDGLKGREWDWKESGEKGSGVVAQELEQVLPHLVHEDDEGMKSVSYNGLVAYLIEEVKALRAEVEALKS